MRLIDELDELHASYVHAINAAVTDDDHARAERLAESYDDDVLRLVSRRLDRAA